MSSDSFVAVCMPFCQVFFKYNFSLFLLSLFLSAPLSFTSLLDGDSKAEKQNSPSSGSKLALLSCSTLQWVGWGDNKLGPKRRAWRDHMVSLAVIGSSVDRLGRKPRSAPPVPVGELQGLTQSSGQQD